MSKLKIDNADIVASAAALKAISTSGLADGTVKKLSTDFFCFFAEAVMGDHEADDEGGYWIKNNDRINPVVSIVADGYDFSGLNGTDLSSVANWITMGLKVTHDVKLVIDEAILLVTNWLTHSQAEKDSLLLLMNSHKEWFPPQGELGLGAFSGVSVYGAIGGGLQYAFDGASDDEGSFNLVLRNQGVNYDGSKLKLTLYYQLSSNASGTDDANLIVDQQFVGIGTDTDQSVTSINESITLDGKLAGQVYSYELTTHVEGSPNDALFMISSMINAAGAGQGSYTGTIWKLGYVIEKV